MTELEKKFIEIFKNESQDFGDGFEDITSYVLDYESELLGLSINQVKGIIGSLVNKKILQMDEVNGENALIYWEREEE